MASPTTLSPSSATLTPPLPRSAGLGRQRAGSHSGVVSAGDLAERSPSPMLFGSSASWMAFVSPDLLDSLDEKERKRQEAIHELMTTEELYLSYLGLVRDDFQRPMRRQNLLAPEEMDVLFKDWDSLLDLSQSMVDTLHQRRMDSDDGLVLAVGDVISSHIVERANSFLRYCSSHREASALLTNKIVTDKTFAFFLKVKRATKNRARRRM